jgi:hypothetical protein
MRQTSAAWTRMKKVPHLSSLHAARVCRTTAWCIFDRGGKRVQVFTIEGKFVRFSSAGNARRLNVR